jgi:adenylate cyclase
MSRPPADQLQHCCIVFADIAGSTRLFERLGDLRAREMIGHGIGLLRTITEAYNGRVVKTIGDEIMSVFDAAQDATNACIEMQRCVIDDAILASERIGLRVGLHAGEVLAEGDDVFGDAVNTAARMVGMAKREQIITTAATIAECNGQVFNTRALGKVHVAGKTHPIDVVDVLWQDDVRNITMITRAVAQEEASPEFATLTLQFKEQRLIFARDHAPLHLGRDANSSVIIDADWVSRNHAMFEYKQGRFVFIDRSTNGSFVCFDGEEELKVHREEMPLRRNGRISLGISTLRGTEHLIRFELS